MLSGDAENELKEHAEKYAWIGFKYNGPGWTVKDFKERLKEISASSKKQEDLSARQKEIEEDLGLSSKISKMFEAARIIMWIKNYGKEGRYQSYFYIEKLIQEIAQRTGLSVKEIKFLTKEELFELLINKKDFGSILEKRLDATLHLFLENKELIFEGEEAKKTISVLKAKAKKVIHTDKLIGTPASPGFAKGKVKVVNTVKEMPKMQNGDILIAHQTNPDLAMAMEKAAAIVTEVGGLTCHAAIIARELGKPAIVGVKDLLSALKDGDLVEVNAEKGTVTLVY